MTHFVGIDPGAKGGVAMLSESGAVVAREPLATIGTRLDPRGMLTQLERFYALPGVRPDRIAAYVEQVSARPGQGVTSVFTFGHGCGLIEMALVALGWRYELVSPQRWQKTMHAGVEKTKLPDPKDRSRVVAQRLWPLETFHATERAKTAHLGIVDALLIAEYGRRQGGRVGAETAPLAREVEVEA